MGTTEAAIKDAVNTLGVSYGNTYQFSDTKKGVKAGGQSRGMARSAYYMAATSDSLGTLSMETLMADNSVDESELEDDA